MSLTEFLSQAIPNIITQFFTMVMTLLITAVQVIAWPVNQVLTTSFPSLSDQISSTVTNLNSMLGFFPYMLTYLPPAIGTLIVFIVLTEITLLAVFRSTYLVSKLWKIVQTIKFW